MKRRRYDDKFRASAVVMLEAAGYPENKFKLQEVATSLKVPSRTLRRWHNGEHNPPPDNVVIEQKRDLSLRLDDLAHRLLDKAFQVLDIDEPAIQQVVTSLGIVVDKKQLIDGKATERVDHTGLTRDQRISKISALLDGRATGRTSGTPRSTDD